VTLDRWQYSRASVGGHEEPDHMNATFTAANDDSTNPIAPPAYTMPACHTSPKLLKNPSTAALPCTLPRATSAGTTHLPRRVLEGIARQRDRRQNEQSPADATETS
jgi:hypothetical protein